MNPQIEAYEGYVSPWSAYTRAYEPVYEGPFDVMAEVLELDYDERKAVRVKMELHRYAQVEVGNSIITIYYKDQGKV